jgi:thiol-disulfide isomerase/thioredoxin
MAVTSTMLPLGTRAPDFSLPDAVTGNTVSLGDFADKDAVLVMFICNHCPYVRHIRHGLAEFGSDYADSGLGIVAINANDVETHPGDRPEEMAKEAADVGYTFPYLFDETQQVAISYTAMCTPDLFLFDGDRKLVYRGRFDDARPNTIGRVTGADLRAAVDAVLSGQAVTEEQWPSMGCSIKWKQGNVPEYFSAATS